jgi:hypothetical protein
VAQADIITVPNFSFESDLAANDGDTAPISFWTVNSASTFNPDANNYQNATGRNTPTGGDGAQSAAVLNTGSLQSAASLATVQQGSIYSLTVAVGNPTNQTPGDLRLGFLIGDTFVNGGDVTLTSATANGLFADQRFTDYSFNYTASAADAGKTLKIFLGQTTTGFNLVGFDNVRLSAVATPEPSTYAMMALGLVALCVLGAKRKKNEEAI